MLARTVVLQYTAERRLLENSQPYKEAVHMENDSNDTQPDNESSQLDNKALPAGGAQMVRDGSHQLAKGLHAEQQSTMSDSSGIAVKNDMGAIHVAQNSKKLKCTVSWLDALAFFAVLFIIIFCATLRYHSQACRHSAPQDKISNCFHPTLKWMGKGFLQRVVSTPRTATMMNYLMMFFPLVLCLCVSCMYAKVLTRKEYGWKVRHTVMYITMAFITGILSGVIGIGGGLIFSPFFIQFGIHPAIAVATSSTCVIFTSASTTIQYILMDRVIIPLAIVYGAVNILASFLGTKLVHILQDNFGPRKSFITMVVMMGILASVVLAAIELGDRVT